MLLKVIFLDLDGVLNTDDFLHQCIHTDDGIDPKLITILNRIIKDTNTKIVISSDWRHGKTMAQLQAILDKFGFVGDIVGMTDDNDKSRWSQIVDWMDNIEVDDFVILDDMDVMSHVVNMPTFKRLADKHFFRTNKDIGLTDEIADRIIMHMNVG